MRPLHALVLLALAVAACAHSSGEVPMAQAPLEQPWTLSVADGSANRYRFACDALGAVQFAYEPVTPRTSSSGVYSGGPPRAETLGAKDARLAELWRLLKALEADASLHTPNRAMGTGAIAWDTQAGRREFIVQRGPGLDELLAVLARFGR